MLRTDAALRGLASRCPERAAELSASCDEGALVSAARQLKARWSDWQGLPDEDKIWDYVRATQIVRDDVTSNRGDVEAALAAAAVTVTSIDAEAPTSAEVESLIKLAQKYLESKRKR